MPSLALQRLRLPQSRFPPIAFEEGAFAAAVPTPSWPFRVVSWNIYLGRRYAAVDDLFARHAGLVGADVVALQEVARRHDRGEASQARRLAFRHRLNYVYAPAHRCGLRLERGQAILTSHPIERSWTIPLPRVRHRRIALAADIRVGSELLRVINVHLENRGRLSPFILRQRAAQILHVLRDLRHEPPARTVLMGDFNTLGHIVDRGRSELLPALLAAEGYADAHGGRKAITHRPFRARLDWIFSKDLPALAGDVINSGWISDHLPVWADLRR